jgi:hypothetical protein
MVNMREWMTSCLPEKAQAVLTRYGLFAFTCLGLRRISVVLLRGVTHRTNRQGTLLVAGHEPWVRYLPGRFFLGEPDREQIGDVCIWELPRLLNRLRGKADMTLVRADQLSAQKFFGKGFLAIPEWVGTRIAVPDDLDAVVRGNRSIHEDMRLVRRHRLHPSVTEGEERFQEFYESMYVPFTRTRHGALAFVKSRHDLRRCLRKGGILWIVRGDLPLAGILFERKHDTLDLHALGMVAGDLPLNKRGLTAALYYYSMVHARQMSCGEVDFKGVRPSLHDGLLRYKRKWGATLYDRADTYYDLLVRWNGVNGVVKDFLSHTGLIFRDGGRLSGIHADESQSDKSLWIGGLHRLYLLTESGPLPMVEEGTLFSIAGAIPDSQQTSYGAR